MQKRRLGKTDILISPIGLGTVKFGRMLGLKYKVPHRALPTARALDALLGCARDLGINLLDTAPAYGCSEERLGKLLLNQRKEWVIATKVGEEFINGQSQFDFSQEAIIKSIERSLSRLKTDFLDVVLVHSNGEDEHLIQQDQVLETLASLKKSGKIRSYGMSTKTVKGGLLTIDQADLAMVTHNLLHTEECEVIRYAHQQQKGILIKKALASGHLSNVDEALQFILKEPGVTTIIIGTLQPLHLKNNVASVANAL